MVKIKDLKEGDVLVSESGYERMVLGVHGKLVHIWVSRTFLQTLQVSSRFQRNRISFDYKKSITKRWYFSFVDYNSIALLMLSIWFRYSAYFQQK